MNSSLVDIRARVERLRGRHGELVRQAMTERARAQESQQDGLVLEEALVVVRAVALETQRQLEYHLSELTSLALREVFGPDAYRLDATFVERRGKTECDIMFMRGDEAIAPLTASGGGAVDVASFALRLTLWTLEKSAPVMVLDEPFRFLSADLMPQAGALLRQLSERLGVQFIVVTHSEALAGEADKTFNITQDGKGVSHAVHSGMDIGEGEGRGAVVAPTSGRRLGGEGHLVRPRRRTT